MRAEWDLTGRVNSAVPVRERIVADEEVIRNLRRTSTGIRAVSGVVRDMKEEIVLKEGALPEERVRFFLACLGMEWLFDVPLDGKWETPEQCKNFLNHLDAKLAELETSAKGLRLVRAAELRAQTLSASLPIEEVSRQEVFRSDMRADIPRSVAQAVLQTSQLHLQGRC